jgi:hypothetical protein
LTKNFSIKEQKLTNSEPQTVEKRKLIYEYAFVILSSTCVRRFPFIRREPVSKKVVARKGTYNGHETKKKELFHFPVNKLTLEATVKVNLN